MKSTIIGLAAAAVFTGALVAQTSSSEKFDASIVSKIRDEGMNRSQAKETLFWLADAKGPRLTGSQAFEDAGDWAVKQLQSWGVTNAHKERWAFGKGWALNAFHATMTAPQTMAIIGLPKAWSAGTNGTVTAEVVRPVIANEADTAKYKGQLRGKIVLTQPTRDVRMLDQGDGMVLRYSDKDGKWEKEAMTPPPPRAGGAGRGGDTTDPNAAGAAGAGAAGGAAGAARGGRGGRGGANGFNVNQFYKDEGVLALFDRGGNSDMASAGSNLTWMQQHPDGGTIFVQSGTGTRTDTAGTAVPEVTLAIEHYNRMVRLLDHNIPVKVELNIGVSFRDEPAGGGGFNIVGDIPGSDLANEIVLIGAHFDSWHGATGATDNGTGSTAMLEVMRIIKTLGLHPRRTIRIGLWGGEEEGLLGSKAYATEHLGTRQGTGAAAVVTPKPELAKTVAYFNLDNGTGKIRGVWMENNAGVGPVFKAWAEPLKDLGVTILSPRAVSQTDHTSFDVLGVPAFQFVQERLEYNSRTHHSNMDFYDHVQFDDLKQQATVAAVFAWLAANRDAALPRK